MNYRYQIPMLYLTFKNCIHVFTLYFTCTQQLFPPSSPPPPPPPPNYLNQPREPPLLLLQMLPGLVPGVHGTGGPDRPRGDGEVLWRHRGGTREHCDAGPGLEAGSWSDGLLLIAGVDARHDQTTVSTGFGNWPINRSQFHRAEKFA